MTTHCYWTVLHGSGGTGSFTMTVQPYVIHGVRRSSVLRYNITRGKWVTKTWHFRLPDICMLEGLKVYWWTFVFYSISALSGCGEAAQQMFTRGLVISEALFFTQTCCSLLPNFYRGGGAKSVKCGHNCWHHLSLSCPHFEVDRDIWHLKTVSANNGPMSSPNLVQFGQCIPENHPVSSSPHLITKSLFSFGHQGLSI